MDESEKAQEFMLERVEQVEKELCEGASENEIVRRLKRMTAQTRMQWTAEVERYVRTCINALAEGLEADGKLPSITIPLTFNYTDNSTTTTSTIIGCRNCSIPPPAARPKRVRKTAPKKIQAVKLHFYLIRDDRLSFDDRIVFSLLCKYAKINRRIKPTRLKTLKRFTGFRQETIIRSLLTLLALGYVDTNQVPRVTRASVAGTLPTLDNGCELVGFRKMEWLNNGNVRWQVFHGVLMTNKKAKQSQPAWFVKSLGISRATAFRYLKSVQGAGTDETLAGTDETKTGTDETMAGTNEAQVENEVEC
jgi:hypothetical protein